VADCYTLTFRAFDLAERFRCPVFLLTDKEVASTMDTVETSDLTPLPVRERETADAECLFRPYDYPALDENVPMSPFGGPHLLRFTTSTHDERGYLTKDPVKVARLNRHLIAKIEQHRDEIELVRADADDTPTQNVGHPAEKGADVLLISYGITARAMGEAVRQARASGHKVSALTLLSLWPLPESALRQAYLVRQAITPTTAGPGDQGESGTRRVVVAELNDGQVRREIERLVCEGVEVVGVHRLDGELITPQQILKAGGLL